MKPRSKAERLRDTSYAEGGSGAANRMVKPQAAGPAAPARTGKVQTAAPGKSAASGGPKTPRGASLAMPAVPGKTSPVRKGR